jgi:NitT/TauT family transport system substrate-binding protein
MASAGKRRGLGPVLAVILAFGLGCTPSSAPPAPAATAAVPRAAQAPAATSAPAGPAAAAQPAPPRKVRYGELKLLSDAGVYLGVDEGYFAEQGIELELVTFDSAANMVAPLATNQLEVGGGAPSAGLYNALRTGVNVRIVADKGHSDPTPPGFPVSIYLVRKALVDQGTVKGIADLRGLRFAQPARGISPELDLVAFLREGGLTPQDLDTTIMGFPDMVPAFANDNLDFAFSVEPFATILLNQGVVSLMKYDYEINPYHQVAVLLYSPDFSKSDLAVKFMTAYLKGVRLYNDAFLKREPGARERAINALIEHTPVKNRALYDQMTLSALDPDGRMNLQSFDQQQDYFITTGTEQARVDLQGFIDLQHAEAAARQLGPYR